jgi:hypothetical protein
MWYDT